VFKRSFFSPLPVAKSHIRCFHEHESKERRERESKESVGKPESKKEKKCYRVDKKTGLVLGRPTDANPFVLSFGKNGKSVETPTGHAMQKKDFRLQHTTRN